MEEQFERIVDFCVEVAKANLFLLDKNAFRHGFYPRYRPCFLGIPPRRTLKHDTRLPLLPFFRFTNPMVSATA